MVEEEVGTAMARINTTAAAGGVAGAGGTIGLRMTMDQRGDTSITRPSVLFGLGTGATALGLYWASGMRRMISLGQTARQLAYGYGIAATASGVASAFYPRGASLTDPQLPTLPA